MTINVMITGVTGLIGNVVWRSLSRSPDEYALYGLTRRYHASARISSGELDHVPTDRWRLADLSEFDAVRRAFDGMDVVVHMGADPRADAPWEAVLHSNIIGSYNTYEACRLSGVKRIVYASSVMVSWGYQFDEPYKAIVEGRYDDVPKDIPRITKESAVRPTDLYPSSKVWGEALGRYYADVHGLSVICLRIGAVQDPDRPSDSPQIQAVWCSHRDIAHLVERSINAPDDLRFDIFYGVSDNKYRYVDIEHARKVLGYVPQDSAEEHVT